MYKNRGSRIKIKSFLFCSRNFSTLLPKQIIKTPQNAIFLPFISKKKYSLKEPQNHATDECDKEISKRVNIVNSKESAKRIVNLLMNLDYKNRYFAIDTETIGVDPTWQSPLYTAHLVSASIFCGLDVNFGSGPSIWIDNLKGDFIMEFKDFLEDEKRRKIFHNYSFDRHVLENYGIRLRGFAADTLHMARLHFSDRIRYSLNALSGVYLNRQKIPFKTLFNMDKNSRVPKENKKRETIELSVTPLDAVRTEGEEKLPAYKKKQSSEIEDLEAFKTNPLALQCFPETRVKWVDYCIYDTEATWKLHRELSFKLREMNWRDGLTMMNFYERVYVPFAEVLVSMETKGVHVDKELLNKSCKAAYKELDSLYLFFKKWAIKYEKEAHNMNPRSTRQLQQLIFAPKGDKDIYKTTLSKLHKFKEKNLEGKIFPGQNKPKKTFEFFLKGLGLKPISRTPTGKPQINIEVLQKLSGYKTEDGKIVEGLALKQFKSEEEGKLACEALGKLAVAKSTEKLVNTYLETLGSLVMPDNRIHCSMNLNTNTGRINCKSPNLQNQPAGRKDKYNIRKAFKAEKGNKLIVADYSQIELRVLAHVSKCQSMIESFKNKEDFHSQTAVQIFPHVAKAVRDGRVILDPNSCSTGNKKPTVKEVFNKERQRAKGFNFSLVYGKTVSGFAKDFDMEVEEVKSLLKLWFSARPEVKLWMDETVKFARKNGYVRTLLGRYRHLKDINTRRKGLRFHAERLAINSPIQGGAADIVTMAMIRINNCPKLRKLGWRLILQIHDEVILEGPSEHSREAETILESHLKNPLSKPLLVDLEANINSVDNWAEGK